MSSEQVELIIAKLDKIEKLIFGNGHIGICERVRNLERFYKIFAYSSLALNILLMVLALKK